MKQAAPELVKTLLTLNTQAVQLAADAGFGKGFVALLEVRASQLNGCAHCLRMHAREALEAGESADRLSVLPAWRETGYFDDTERAALALIEAVTFVADGHVADEVYDAAASVLSEQQIAAVEWVAVVINSWNRMAIASRYDVRP